MHPDLQLESGCFFIMLSLSSLQNTKQDRPAAVLGGGPSLPEDLKTIQAFTKNAKTTVLIAVNYHAHVIGINADFMVYNDDPETDPAGMMARAIEEFEGIKVSLDTATSDVYMDADYWEGMYSSNLATWFADWLGCAPIYLCGMDCYQGNRVYCHDYVHDTPVFHYKLDDHLRIWQEEGIHKLRIEVIQAVSGPLQRIFGGVQ